MQRSRAAALLGLMLVATLRCQSEKTHPPFLGLELGSAGKPNDGGFMLPDVSPTPDGLCGDQTIPAVTNPPNVYFVVDRSGSMQEQMPGTTLTKLQASEVAISTMLRAVGHRIRYGAAVFPVPNTNDSCQPGHEIYPTTAGDPPSYAQKNENGPLLADLLQRLRNQEPASGSTPTAASLLALIPTLRALSGKTYVVLMTDGAPNCNSDLRCGVDGCMPNIEQQLGCTATYNCCDPAVVGAQGPLGQCVDSTATIAAVAELAQLGIDTYVVGMPGAEPYANVLDALATAGNTARAGSSAYYAVGDTTALETALKAIGSQLAISCDLPLAQAPTDPTLVNVFFDGKLVPANPDGSDDGWAWTGPQSIQIRGSSCAELSSGDVYEVLVLAGCPTVLR